MAPHGLRTAQWSTCRCEHAREARRSGDDLPRLSCTASSLRPHRPKLSGIQTHCAASCSLRRPETARQPMLRLDARPSSPRPAMCSAVRRKYVVFLCALPGFGFYWPWGLSITLLSGVVVTTTPATSSPPCMSVNGGQGHQVIRAARGVCVHTVPTCAQYYMDPETVRRVTRAEHGAQARRAS